MHPSDSFPISLTCQRSAFVLTSGRLGCRLPCTRSERNTLCDIGPGSSNCSISGYTQPLPPSVRSLAFYPCVVTLPLLQLSLSPSPTGPCLPRLTPLRLHTKVSSNPQCFVPSRSCDRRPLAWDNTSVHILNSAFALSEILLTFAGPISWLYLPVCILTIGLYIALAYVTHASQNFYRSFPNYLALLLSILTLLLCTKPTSSWTQPRMVERLRPTSLASWSESASSSPSHGGSQNSGTKSLPNAAPRPSPTLPLGRRSKQARSDRPPLLFFPLFRAFGYNPSPLIGLFS